MTTSEELAVQLLTANLAYRTVPAANPYESPDYATYIGMLEELAANKSAAGVLIEMTQFAGTPIMRLAAMRDEDPLQLWRAIAIANASHGADGDENELQ